LIPLAYIAHWIPGRVRLKVDSMRGEHGYFAAVTAMLRSAPGVADIRASVPSSSLVIHHQGQLVKILDYAYSEGLFLVADERRASPPRRVATHPARGAHRTQTRANAPALRVANDVTRAYCLAIHSNDSAPLVPDSITRVPTAPGTGRALVRLACMNASNSAVEKLSNAYAAYRILESPWIALVLAGMGIYQLVRGDVLSSALALIEHWLEEQEVFA